VKNATTRPDVEASIATWAMLCALGLGSVLSWHVLFSDWDLCECEHCSWNGGAR
jgi:hypothetical protein